MGFLDFFKSSPTAYQNLSPEQFAVAIKQQGAQLIDVRTPGEFSGGHLPGATNINVSSADFGARVAALDKARPVFVYCRSGMRSGSAANMLVKAGFEAVHNLSGGVMAWPGPLKR